MKSPKTLVFLSLLSCSQPSKTDPRSLAKEIESADLAMSKLAGDIGFNNAVLQYADSSIVKLSEGKPPIEGITAFSKSYDHEKDIKTISWTPSHAEVAQSGELGYTWGTWTLNLPDTVFLGKYFTVWKKNARGEWKVVLDGGNGTNPPPN
ncbi:MAG TPA: hypothetical protein PKM27_10690 [Saprospiraceae bacterium]|nr:hypothetical protein [Saprospiraceae bacterium]HNT19389.1 hypothetical protein [Saprospiraceae bacterium]